MASENVGMPEMAQSPTPNPALKILDALIGTWQITDPEAGPGGGVHGQVRFEWLEGGFFLVQHVDLVNDGRPIRGAEYIGYDEASQSLRSHYFGNNSELLEYVLEVDGDSLTIWGGYVGSPARCHGTFSADRNSATSRWEWPGGGYPSVMTRIG